MNDITKKLLGKISDFAGSFTGAFSIRENGCSVGRQSSENIKIDSKTDEPRKRQKGRRHRAARVSHSRRGAAHPHHGQGPSAEDLGVSQALGVRGRALRRDGNVTGLKAVPALRHGGKG